MRFFFCLFRSRVVCAMSFPRSAPPRKRASTIFSSRKSSMQAIIGCVICENGAFPIVQICITTTNTSRFITPPTRQSISTGWHFVQMPLIPLLSFSLLLKTTLSIDITVWVLFLISPETARSTPCHHISRSSSQSMPSTTKSSSSHGCAPTPRRMGRNSTLRSTRDWRLFSTSQRPIMNGPCPRVTKMTKTTPTCPICSPSI